MPFSPNFPRLIWNAIFPKLSQTHTNLSSSPNFPRLTENAIFPKLFMSGKGTSVFHNCQRPYEPCMIKVAGGLEFVRTHILMQLLNLGIDLGIAWWAGWETVEQDVFSVILCVFRVNLMVVPLCPTWEWWGIKWWHKHDNHNNGCFTQAHSFQPDLNCLVHTVLMAETKS